MNQTNKTSFAPELIIENGVKNIDFYSEAFGAIELRRFSNDDGTIHVAELSIAGCVFHLHEVSGTGTFSPDKYDGTTVKIGLFVPDVDAVMKSALAAGAKLVSLAQDYDYGYRQGEIEDPFGHVWMLEMRI